MKQYKNQITKLADVELDKPLQLQLDDYRQILVNNKKQNSTSINWQNKDMSILDQVYKTTLDNSHKQSKFLRPLLSKIIKQGQVPISFSGLVAEKELADEEYQEYLIKSSVVLVGREEQIREMEKERKDELKRIKDVCKITLNETAILPSIKQITNLCGKNASFFKYKTAGGIEKAIEVEEKLNQQSIRNEKYKLLVEQQEQEKENRQQRFQVKIVGKVQFRTNGETETQQRKIVQPKSVNQMKRVVFQQLRMSADYSNNVQIKRPLTNNFQMEANSKRPMVLFQRRGSAGVYSSLISRYESMRHSTQSVNGHNTLTTYEKQQTAQRRHNLCRLEQGRRSTEQMIRRTLTNLEKSAEQKTKVLKEFNKVQKSSNSKHKLQTIIDYVDEQEQSSKQQNVIHKLNIDMQSSRLRDLALQQLSDSIDEYNDLDGFQILQLIDTKKQSEFVESQESREVIREFRTHLDCKKINSMLEGTIREQRKKRYLKAKQNRYFAMTGDITI